MKKRRENRLNTNTTVDLKKERLMVKVTVRSTSYRTLFFTARDGKVMF